MYAILRRYTPKTGTTPKAIEEFSQRIEEKFVPVAQEIRGFHTYAVLSATNKELVSISIFEDREGATLSTRKAAEFVQKDPLKDQLSKPEVVEGELLVLKEAGAGIR